FFLSAFLRPPTPTPFPYTTLFRSYHLPGENVTDRIHHHFRLLITVVAHQLAEILKSQTHGNLVASGGGYKVVQPLEVYRGQLVEDRKSTRLNSSHVSISKAVLCST